jgi:hypothetical protein
MTGVSTQLRPVRSVASMDEPVRLRDGSIVTIRPVKQTDQAALRGFLEGLSEKARRLRFFAAAVDLVGASQLAAMTGPGRFGLLAHDQTGMIVAHALYVQLDSTRAEVAVEVADHLHGRGLGTILIQRLATEAERGHITDFIAEVLPQNYAMLDVFRGGFGAHIALHDGLDTVQFPTSAWRTAQRRFSDHG